MSPLLNLILTTYLFVFNLNLEPDWGFNIPIKPDKSSEAEICNCDSESDSLALVELWENTDGENLWINKWVLEFPVSQWYGVSIDPDSKCVIQLNLSLNGLKGTLPNSITNLSNLEQLDLSNNDIVGFLPNEIGSLTYLQRVYLNNNELLGILPNSFYQLKNLVELNLSNNDFSGPIDSSINQLTKLKWLFLSHNNFSENLPVSIVDLIDLERLALANNQFTGPLPSDLSDLINLQLLHIENNQFTGVIDLSFSKLTRLKSFYLQNNLFSEIADLSILNIPEGELRLSGNQLTFEHILPNLESCSGHYAPQDSFVILEEPLEIIVNCPVELDLNFDINVFQNQYLWFQNGELRMVDTKNSFEISGINEADAGVYHLQVKNTLVPDLTLYSYPFEISIVPCRPFDSLSLWNFYQEMDGPNTWPITWEASLPIENWSGVVLNSETQCVEQLILEDYNLQGSLSQKINALKSLKILDISSNQVTDVSALENLDQLEKLQLGWNQLTQLPNFSINSQLTTLSAFGNQLTALPELNNLAFLSRVEVQNNRLDFSDLEILSTLDLTQFDYAPQDSIPVQESGNQLIVLAGGAPANNTYHWYKFLEDGLFPIDTIRGDSSFEAKTSGKYHCVVTNLLLDNLSLNSFTISVERNCPPVEAQLTQSLCEGGSIVINDITLDENNPRETILFPEGSSTGCDSILNITVNFIPCELIPNGFTPNNDGINDFFVIPLLIQNPQIESELTVFNRWGDVVYQQKPYANDWGGQNKTNQPLPGGTYYYKFIAEGEEVFGEVFIFR